MVMSIAQAAQLPSRLGDPLPDVIRPLHRLGVHLRVGELSLWSAGSGTGKSVLLQWYALHAKVPTLYISADSNWATMSVRSASMATGLPQEEASKHIHAKRGQGFDALHAAQHISWSFEASPTLEDIRDEVLAFEVAHGDFPRLIVVDNLRDVTGDSYGDEYRFWDEVLAFLRTMGQKIESHVAVTHHVTGQYAAGDRPVPLNGLENKPDKRAEIVITAYTPSGRDDRRVLSVVKNRSGQASGDGSYNCVLGFSGSTMQLAEL